MIVLRKILFILIIALIYGCSQKVKDEFDYQNRADLKQMIELYDRKKIDEDAEGHYIDALVLQSQERWAESLIDLNLAVEKDSSAGIFYSIAKAYIELGRIELSLKALEHSLSLNGKFLPSLELLVEIHINNRNYNRAIEIYQEIVKIDNSFQKKLNFANIIEYYKPLESIKIYEDLLQEAPTNDRILLKLTRLYKQTKQKDKYIKSLERLLDANQTSSKFQLELLDYYVEDKSYLEAIEMLDKIDKNIATSELEKFYGTVGFSLLNDEDFNDSEVIKSYLNKIDSRFYFNWQIQLQSAYLYSKIKDTLTTHKIFKKVLKVSDTIPDIPISIAIYYLQRFKDSLAVDILEESIGTYNKDYRFPFFLGIANQSSKNFESAISYFKKSIELNTNFVDNWIQIGAIYDLMGKIDSSDYYYEMALELEPDNALVNNNYAYSLSLRKKDLNRAKEMSELALKKEPKNTPYLDTYAWINYLMGNYSIALEYIEKAIKNGSPSAEVYEHYGDILRKLDRENDALDAYQTALKIDPERKSILERINNLKE